MIGTRMRKFGIAITLLGVFGGVAAGIYGSHSSAGPETALPHFTQFGASLPAARELASVEVTMVKPRSMIERIRVSGELRPVNRAVLRAKVIGTVLEVNARQGQAVKSGEVLIRFETEDLQSALIQRRSNLEAAAARLTLAEQTLEKSERLAQQGITSKAALEKARSDAAAARANVRSLSAETDTARTALRNADLLAPFDGIVASRNVEPGEPTAANTELLSLVDTSVFEAEVSVSTRDIARLQVGQVAELQVDGLDRLVITGTVDRINPVAREGSRFVPVFIRFENTSGRMWGGMFASGAILVRASENIFALPESALRRDRTGPYVLKLAGGRLVRQAVKIGPRWDGGASIEIIEGIASGETVLIAPLPNLEADTPAVVSSAG